MCLTLREPVLLPWDSGFPSFTKFSTNITLIFIFPFFNPTAENLGDDKSSRWLNGTFSADQTRMVKNYDCGLEFITFPQISNIFHFNSFTVSFLMNSDP